MSWNLRTPWAACVWVLGQATQPGRLDVEYWFPNATKETRLFLVCGIFAAILLLFLIFVGLARKWLKNDDPTFGLGAFSLNQLRQMRDSGQITQDEFSRAKSILLADHDSDNNTE